MRLSGTQISRLWKKELQAYNNWTFYLRLHTLELGLYPWEISVEEFISLTFIQASDDDDEEPNEIAVSTEADIRLIRAFILYLLNNTTI